MKLQLDFDEKTVKIESDIQLKKLMKNLKQLLPDWKEWTIAPIVKQEVRHVYSNPIWYVNPWYTEWRYWDPVRYGVNDSGTVLIGETDAVTVSTSDSSTTTGLLNYVSEDENGCHFNVSNMTGIHDVLIN